ncbi:MAG TPA: aminopeptidase P family protein [Paenalcaligenes sp.]|nr:aminopeptidase P family protein [Paenalcaligenes sp.]
MTISDQISIRLEALRTLMIAHQIDAYLVLTSDPHLSEYLPEHWQARRWLTGFDGSAGTLLVTRHEALLWTDSRYWVQAEQSLGQSGIQLMKQGDTGVPEPDGYLQQHLPAGSVLCMDSTVTAITVYEHWQALAREQRWTIQEQDALLDDLWADRPALPTAPVYAHEPPFNCRLRADNFSILRAQMQTQQVDWHLLSSLDDIAWLLGLRGSDVAYNPVFLAHFLLGQESAYLFIDEQKLSSGLRQALAADGVQILAYEQLSQQLAQLPAAQCLWIDDNAVTAGSVRAARHMSWLRSPNPTTLLKARKNQQEQAHLRETMVQDGIALCEFYAWFEQEITQRPVSELEVDEQLTAARARRAHFISPSFGTIAGFNANGALPHYQASKEHYSWIEGDGLLLIDSGGQYLGGTTDITRVTPVGQVSAAQKRDFSLVLKAMIALSRAVFPAGVSGQHIDAIARMPLWQAHLDYGHGTGHGVGYFLNVHEGPQNISWRLRPGRQMVPLQEGMVSSNEPAVYRAGQWGIRIENLVLVQPAADNEFGDFYGFETLTLCPIDTRCIDIDLLDREEIDWLNEYHATVRQQLAAHLKEDALQWLLARTEPI